MMRKSKRMKANGDEATVGGSGLSTEQAFDRLLSELATKLEFYMEESKRNWREVIQSSFSTKSRHSTLTWSSLSVLLLECFVIFILYVFNYSNMWLKLLPEAMFMLLIASVNVAILIWDNYKRVNELPNKLAMIGNYLAENSHKYDWKVCNYPELFMPLSPCITMQWVFRDGKMVNLPWALIVTGDVIVLQPAQKIIADCRLLSDPARQLYAGEIFSPSSASPSESSTHNPPRLHAPLTKNLATVTATPYMEMIDLSYQQFLCRPPTFYNKERHAIVTRIIELIILPLAMMSFIALCLVRMFYLPHWLGIRVAPWADIILLQPMANTFPLLPVSLPFIWTLMQCVGNAKIWEGVEVWGYQKPVRERKGDDSKLDVDGAADKSQTESNTAASTPKNFIERCQQVLDFFLGREETLFRSQKLLHVLASLTALCCVDKKGVLSWPNPTADKIFFLNSMAHPTHTGAAAGSNNNENIEDTNANKAGSINKHGGSPPATTTTAEVLDITHDNNNELHFDDTSWQDNLSHLKPLGLNILLNTCNEKTRNVYCTFHSHISHELYDEKKSSSDHDLVVPVTSRRCLCEVAKIIGFTDNATDAFRLEQELCSFRHIESDQLSRDKLTKAKIKFPFPHMMAVVVSEKQSQGLQLMTQGTGDLILDACEDFWDGKDLKPLTDYERKLILDFYQRTSLSSICTAFSYKPLSAKVCHKICSEYLELPPSKGLRFLPYYALTNIHDVDMDKLQDSFASTRDSSISTDCLLLTTDSQKDEEVTDLKGCIQIQSGQIFIGMVTMQYQACMDMVQLIEQLDQACIRFVHFSKENELRSRVFSEKMGLESGWNCHITLKEGSLEENHEEESGSTTGASKETYLGSNLNPRRHSTAKPTLIDEMDRFKSEPIKSRTLLIPDANSALPRCSTTMSVPEMVMRSSSVEPSRCETVLRGARLLLTAENDEEDSRDTEETQASLMLPLLPQNTVGQSAAFQLSSDEEDTHSRVRFEESSKIGSDHADNSNSNSNERVTPSAIDSSSSAIRSPAEGSFQEVYDLVEHPTPLGFDMSNRAKLPRGIDQVRPHLENVDNVPLLVSLFTDCTADNAGEMIRIMQNYGEVTLLMGSVCNKENRSLFLQADASIALEPMYPQSCQQSQPFLLPANGCTPPTEVAMLLTSLSCALSFKRRESVSFYNLIAQARHFMNNCVRNSIQYWICCNVATSFLGLVALLMLLPPLFSLSDSMWLTCVIVPMLTLGTAFSIMGKLDESVMDTASWKNQCQIDRQTFVYAFWFYGMKFIPSMINLSFMAVFNLTWMCSNMPNTTCSWVYPIFHQQHQSPPSGESQFPVVKQTMVEALNPRPLQCISTWSCENADKLLFVQQFTVFFLIFYFVTISACFVYRFKYLWVQNPFMNRVWVFTSLFILSIQLLYGVVKLRNTKPGTYDLLPPFSYIWGVLWAPMVLGFNELIRRHEIKINIRHQKRARLDFGTKLGMNSPF